MSSAELITVILLVAVLAVVTWLAQRSWRLGSLDRGPDQQKGIGSTLETVTTPTGALLIGPPGGARPLFEMSPLSTSAVDTLAGHRPVKFDPSVGAGPAALFTALVKYLPMTEKQTLYVVKFRPEVEKALDTLRLKLVKTSDGFIPTARGDKGRFVANGRIVQEQVQQLTEGQLLAALAVVGVIMFKLDEIEKAVERIEGKLDEIALRLQDDDHGELRSAEALVEVFMPLLAAGAVPEQLKLELAVTRQRVDAIYFSRQRFVDRFRQRIQALQGLEEARRGDEARAWARGTTKEFSNQEALWEETLLYARAMVDRAQLAFCTAGVIALTEGTDEALAVLRHAEGELSASFAGLESMLSELAEERPKWAWVPFNDRKEVHDTARRLEALFAGEVAPLLPRATGETIEFTALSTGEGGAPIERGPDPIEGSE